MRSYYLRTVDHVSRSFSNLNLSFLHIERFNYTTLYIITPLYFHNIDDRMA